MRAGSPLPAGGAVFRAEHGTGVLVGRFAAPSAGVGLLAAQGAVALSLPRGRLSRGWRVAAPTARRLVVCPLPQTEAADEAADQRLGIAANVSLSLANAPSQAASCRTERGVFALGPGRASVRAKAPSVLLVGRRALVPSASAGLLGAGRWEELKLPGARSWTAVAPSAGRLTVCSK
jgi:hypothetical protein